MKNLIAMFFVVVLLVGCGASPGETYCFRQEASQIIKIEIGLIEKYDPDMRETPVILKTLDPAQHQEMIEAILEMRGASVLPPGRGVGVYIIQITYADGEVEMLGDYNNAYITPEGKVVQQGYRFKSDSFYKIISHYLGEKITPPSAT